MVRSAHLELNLRALDDGDYAVEARLQMADSRSEVQLIDGLPPRVQIDLPRLVALQGDPQAYGQSLTTMLFADPRLITALRTARTHADTMGVVLRVSLRLDPLHALLHSVCWETLHDPENSTALLSSERMPLSRYMDSTTMQPVTPRARGTLSALIVVAAPHDLADYDLAPIDVAAEIARAQSALSPCSTTILASGEQRVTLAAIRTALHTMPDILYVIGHGMQLMGQTVVLLEREDGRSAQVVGERFVQQIAGLGRRPLLVVLAACESAGTAHDGAALAAIAPQLARAGIAAVIAMQGRVSQATVAAMMPIFFRELLRDGQVDRALAVARDAVRDQLDWWVPALWLRVQDGQLWLDERASAGDSPVDTLARQSRQRVLQQLRDYWITGVLEQSLHGAALIALGLEARPDYVTYPWEMVFERAGRPVRAIQPGTALAEVFDDVGGELLILGAPGSGKTTMLLDLARELMRRATQDARARVPVIFHLSLWAETRPPLRDWIESELDTRYGIAKALAADWLTNSTLIPLLDGLDEVKPEHRNACVAAINTFWKAYGAGMVVCSRIADYEVLTERLWLRGAVLIQPLADAQIDSYLQRAGDQLAGLREVIGTDTSLRELADSPLMLSMMAMAYQGKSAAEIQPTADQESRRTHLFETYVQRMLIRRRAGHDLPSGVMISKLSWLARGMVQHNLSIFYLDELQPTWLSAKGGQIGYVLGASLLVLLVSIMSGYLLGAVLGGIVSLLTGWAGAGWWIASITGGGLGALAGGIAGGLHLTLSAEGFGLEGVFGRIYTVRRTFWDWAMLKAPLRYTADLRNGSICGFVFGVAAAVALLAAMQSDINAQATTRLDLRAIAPVIGNFFQNPFTSLLGSLMFASSVVALGTAIQSLRRQALARLVQGQKIVGALSRVFFPLNGDSIGGISVIFPCALYATVAIGLSTSLGAGFAIGGIVAILCFVLAALYARFTACSRYESDRRRTANDVRRAPRLIHTALHVSLQGIAGGLCGGLLGLLLTRTLCAGYSSTAAGLPTVVAAIFTNDPSCIGADAWVVGGLLFGIVVSILFSSLSHGFKSFVQRSWLRLILPLAGGLPLHARRLLDGAADRILLRRVGEGYIFVHRLVLEYFAALSTAQSASLLGSLNWAIIERAETLRDLGRLDEALDVLSQALEHEPGSYDAATKRAMIYRRLGQHEETLQDLDRAVKLFPDKYWARVQRGVTLRIIERYDESLTELTRAIRLEAKPEWALIERSITYRMLKRFVEAIADATAALKFDPQWAGYYAQRGIALREDGHLVEALEDFTKAVELSPNDDWILFQRGFTYCWIDRYDEALADFSQAITLDPAYIWPYYQRALIYRNLKRYDEALADHDQTIALSPGGSGYYTERGQTYRRIGRYDEALADFSQAIILDPERAWPYGQRASTYRDLERYDEALVDVNQALTLRSESDWDMYQRSLIHYKRGELDLAQTDIAQAINLARQEQEKQPSNRVNLFNLVVYLLAGGKSATAHELLDSVLSQGATATELADAILDLEEYRHIFPDDADGEKIYSLLIHHYDILRQGQQ